MTRIIYITLLFLTPSFLIAQIDQPTIGAGYANQSFYNLKNGLAIQYDHQDWDIAFAVSGQGSGIFVNEGVASSFTAPLPQVELYLTASTDFANADTADMERIYNDEVSWLEGALNHVKDATNPFDLGWGLYDTGTQTVAGTRIFCVKLRNGDYKKLEITSLINGTYTFTYADINGSNETIQTLDKSNFTGKTLVYFSIENAAIKDIEPEKWDLLFTRYSTPLDDGAGGVVDYTVTGVLSNEGVEVAQADAIDPATVDAADYENDYSTELSMIGHDWKAYDFAAGWVLPEDRVYFVKSAELELWKVQFIDFEGSSSGVTTIQKTFETALTSVADRYEYLNTFTCYPNPVHGQINVAFELAQSQDSGVITIFNALGQTVYQAQTNVDAGLNVKQIPLQDIPAGNYYLSLQLGNDVITNSILIR